MIRGVVEVHAEWHWQDREDGTQERVLDACRVEHRDGFVEFAGTPTEALDLIKKHLDRSRRAVEKKDAKAEVAWVTSITWSGFAPDWDIPGFEVKA